MNVAIVGDVKGQLDQIYDHISKYELKEKVKIHLLLCCGDFQTPRNLNDLECVVQPKKYLSMGSFYKYYSGERMAPVLTIFIGGNQEAWNYLQELPFGGWVSPNIYYLGYAGIVNYKGLRIGGVSGVHSPRNYDLDHFERSPYTDGTVRSVYHYRVQDFTRLMQISESVDIMISHEWPKGVAKYGNIRQIKDQRVRARSEGIGAPPCLKLLDKLQPSYWFAAQMKNKFAALILHENRKNTKFLALGACDTLRECRLDDFFAVIDFKTNSTGIAINEETHLQYDLEWLAILHHSAQSDNPSEYRQNAEAKEVVLQKFNGDLNIPNNFERTTSVYDPNDGSMQGGQRPNASKNPQTVRFCDLLGIIDPMELIGGVPQ